MRIRDDLAQARVSYGYRRLHVLLQREGWKVNHKRVYRPYKEEGLIMRNKRPKRHVSACQRMERATAHSSNESWSMDFMSDELYNGQRIKLLTLVDNFTRESLAIEVDERLGGQRVTESDLSTYWDRYEENLRKNLNEDVPTYMVVIPQKYNREVFDKILAMIETKEFEEGYSE